MFTLASDERISDCLDPHGGKFPVNDVRPLPRCPLCLSDPFRAVIIESRGVPDRAILLCAGHFRGVCRTCFETNKDHVCRNANSLAVVFGGETVS
jgi:hypothetical protein